ncbi:MAG TPA: TonB-dependent receptor, partial [Balneolales bacterium]|nr:TonB-dependent receptor [Balneolales bacterium]
NLNHGNTNGSIQWTHIFSKKVFARLMSTGNYYYSEPRMFQAGTYYGRSNCIREFQLKGHITFFPNEHHVIEFGSSSGLRDLSLDNYFMQQVTYSSDIHNFFTNGYLQDTWSPSQKWNIEWGLRINYYSSGKFYRLSPRLNIDYMPHSNIHLLGAFGVYQQFVSLSESNQLTDLNTWQSTANGVGPMTGTQYLFGIKTKPSSGISVDLETYYRNMYHLFELDPLIPDYSGLSYNQLFRFGKGYAYGVEVTLKKQTRRLLSMFDYTYSISNRMFPGINHNAYYPSKYNRKHSLNVVLDYQISRHWKFNTHFTFASGQPYSGLDGLAKINHSPFTSIVRQILIVDHINDNRLPDYHRLDLGITHMGTFFGTGKTELQFQIINVYSHRNTWFYKYDLTTDKMTTESIQMLPILPSLSWSVTW